MLQVFNDNHCNDLKHDDDDDDNDDDVSASRGVEGVTRPPWQARLQSCQVELIYCHNPIQSS